MSITKEKCGAVLLAGGKSRRMGQCKALLEVEGETLLQRTVRMLAAFEELWLSTNDPALSEGLPVRLVFSLANSAAP